MALGGVGYVVHNRNFQTFVKNQPCPLCRAAGSAVTWVHLIGECSKSKEVRVKAWRSCESLTWRDEADAAADPNVHEYLESQYAATHEDADGHAQAVRDWVCVSLGVPIPPDPSSDSAPGWHQRWYSDTDNARGLSVYNWRRKLLDATADLVTVTLRNVQKAVWRKRGAHVTDKERRKLQREDTERQRLMLRRRVGLEPPDQPSYLRPVVSDDSDVEIIENIE